MAEGDGGVGGDELHAPVSIAATMADIARRMSSS
jgi:hypothetical protein